MHTHKQLTALRWCVLIAALALCVEPVNAQDAAETPEPMSEIWQRIRKAVEPLIKLDRFSMERKVGVKQATEQIAKGADRETITALVTYQLIKENKLKPQTLTEIKDLQQAENARKEQAKIESK